MSDLVEKVWMLPGGLFDIAMGWVVVDGWIKRIRWMVR